ncbi:MAG: DUF3638 domain-containing protein [Chlamydiota bacterium]
METAEQEALSLAAKLPQYGHVADLIRIKRLGGFEETLTMEELIGLFIVGQQKNYLEQTYLKQSEIIDLDRAISSYLQQKILTDHAAAALALYDEHGKSSDKDRPYLEKELLKLVNEKPVYDANQHREYLVFEAMSGLRLRQEQVDNLDLLSLGDLRSTVLHMIMGSGKSTVITPIAAFLMARHDFLPMIVVPDSLYQTGKETGKVSVFQIFGKHAHPLEIHRKTDFSKESLQTIADSLQRWKKEKGFIYTTRESLLSFLLKSKELFYRYEEADTDVTKQELAESIQIAWDILKELKESGASLIDEAHSLLNSREELNFTFGRPNHVSRLDAKHVFSILEDLIKDPTVDSLIDLKNNNQAKLSKETYEQVIKPILIEKYIEQFKIEQTNQDAFRGYLNNQTEEIPSFIIERSDRDQIALTKAVLSTFLAHTLTRKCNEHYGLGEKYGYCIPYLGNNTPNEKAEFANYVETLLYTGFYYLQQGLTEAQLKQFRIDCLAKSRKEEGSYARLITETEANAVFKRVTGQDLTGGLNIELAKQYISQNSEVVFEYCMEKVINEISVYPNKLSANPHHLVALTKKSNAMTGTPWNADNYSSQFTTAINQGIENKSKEIMRNIPASEIAILDTDQGDIFEEILKQVVLKKDCRAVIDVGALIKNRTGKEVAQRLLEVTDPVAIDGVVYYDESNELKILERVSGKSVLLQESVIVKERRMTYYDQRHTFGSDIAQGSDARAVLTVSEVVKEFEWFQAMWRMRKIDQRQTLTILLPKDIQHLINDKTDISSADILGFFQKNQVTRERLDNFLSRRLEIKAIVEEAIHDAFMQASTAQDKLKIFEKTKELLIQSMDVSAFEAFGGVEKEIDTPRILEEYTQKWLGILKELEANHAITNSSFYENKIRSLREIPLNPTYQVVNNLTLDTQVENQIENEVEVEIEVATATQSDDFYERGIKPWKEQQWPNINIFKDDFLAIGLCRSAQEAIAGAKNIKVSSMQDVFNPTFFISENYLPAKHLSKGEIPAEPFAWYAKPVYHLVVTQEALGEIKTLLIDQNDLPFFREQLLKDTGQQERRICIYDPRLGMTLHGKKPMLEEELKLNAEFMTHYIYAKFWNGMSEYKDEELTHLERWVQSQGAVRMHGFFQEILRYKKDSAKAFTQSPLAQIFDKLIALETEPSRIAKKRTWPDEELDAVKRVPGSFEAISESSRIAKKRTWPDEDPLATKRLPDKFLS